MKPVAFEHERPATLAEAIRRLGAGSGDVKVMGGGQSLGPMLNLRLARPDTLVDIWSVDELRQVRETADEISIGAMTRHAEIEDGKVSEPISGMMRHVASGIAYRAVRNKGTIGGSLCHADPAADWVTAMTVLDASVVISGPDGQSRSVPMTRFMKGAYRTDLIEGEILNSIRIPRYSDHAVWGYCKICRKTGEFADAIAAFVADPQSRYCRVVFGAVSGRPLISHQLASVLAKTGRLPELADIKAELTRLDPGLSAAKFHQLAVAAQRSVTGALNNG